MNSKIVVCKYGPMADPYNRERALRDEMKQLKEKLNQVYSERNRAALLAARLALKCGLSAGAGIDEREDWDSDWRHVLYIQLTDDTQVSWHMSPDEVPYISALPEFSGNWDGTFLSRDGSFLGAVSIEGVECKK